MSASEDAWRCAARAAARCAAMLTLRVLCCVFDVAVVEKSFIYIVPDLHVCAFHTLIVQERHYRKVHAEHDGR